MQKYNSACTSINSTKIPTVFKKVKWQWMISCTKNLDYGGGKYDTATEYLKQYSITNFVYDKFNRSDVHNQMVLDEAPFDSATLSNVLNVILEEEVRLEVLWHIKSLLKPQGSLFISVYEGNRTRIPSINEKRNSCQLNKPLIDYLEEVQKVFEHCEIKNGVIKAW